jgi:hypothetical protein
MKILRQIIVILIHLIASPIALFFLALGIFFFSCCDVAEWLRCGKLRDSALAEFYDEWIVTYFESWIIREYYED